MAKYILGGGLIGLLAYDILGPSYTLIPHKASRYYSYSPAIADDHIVITPKIDTAILGSHLTRAFRKAISLSGQLLFDPQPWIIDLYAKKIYNDENHVLKKVTRFEETVSTISCSSLYKRLLAKHMDTLTNAWTKYGAVEKIIDGTIITTSGAKLSYSSIISTIPLDVLDKALGTNNVRDSKDVWVYIINTDKLDFEGAHQVLVADDIFPFYKVNKIAKDTYLFFCTSEIMTPDTFFGAFTDNQCEVKNPAGTKLSSYIPIGGPFSLTEYEKLNIHCIGSYAQWDDCADVSTCIVRILNFVE